MSDIKKRCVIIGAAEINNYERIRSYLAESACSADCSDDESLGNGNNDNRGDGRGAYRSSSDSGDFYIFCDGGLKHRCGLGIEPDLIVGDFDSHENPSLDIETIVLPREKDDTDTFFAVKEAVARGYDDFLLLGAFGQRLDHTFGNISILLYLSGLGKKALAVDDYAEFEIVTGISSCECFHGANNRASDSCSGNVAANSSILRDCSSNKAADVRYIDDRFSYFSLISLSGSAAGVSIKNAKYPLESGTIGCDYQYAISNEVISGKIAEVSLAEGTLLLMRVF